jgi:hypothetical protein
MKVFVMMGKRWIIAAAVLAAMAAVFLIPLHVLRIDAPREGKTLHLRMICSGDQFSLTYLHSVERCTIEDNFRVDDGYRIALFSTAFPSSNTGLPTAPQGREQFLREGNTYRIRNMNRLLPVIHLWVDEQYKNTLHMEGKEDLYLPPLAGNTLLSIRSQRMTLLSFIFQKAGTWFA